MNFHFGKSMNYLMRLGLSETTCPQRLREQNPVKVIFVLYDSGIKTQSFLQLFMPSFSTSGSASLGGQHACLRKTIGV
jgi:hypothetical protein